MVQRVKRAERLKRQRERAENAPLDHNTLFCVHEFDQPRPRKDPAFDAAVAQLLDDEE